MVQQVPLHNTWPRARCSSSVRVQASASGAAAAAKGDYRSKPANQINVLVVGPTGYIGK